MNEQPWEHRESVEVKLSNCEAVRVSVFEKEYGEGRLVVVSTARGFPNSPGAAWVTSSTATWIAVPPPPPDPPKRSLLRRARDRAAVALGNVGEVAASITK